MLFHTRHNPTQCNVDICEQHKRCCWTTIDVSIVWILEYWIITVLKQNDHNLKIWSLADNQARGHQNIHQTRLMIPNIWWRWLAFQRCDQGSRKMAALPRDTGQIMNLRFSPAFFLAEYCTFGKWFCWFSGVSPFPFFSSLTSNWLMLKVFYDSGEQGFDKMQSLIIDN